MLNFINIFVLLFFFWVLFILGHSQPLSWFYVFCGFAACLIVSAIAFRGRMINKHSAMIYLSLGFYRHFFSLFFRNFISSIKLLFDMAIFYRAVSPVVARISLRNHEGSLEKSLLAASVNITAGLICVGFDEEAALIHAINHEYLRASEIQKIRRSLEQVNDDEL